MIVLFAQYYALSSDNYLMCYLHSLVPRPFHVFQKHGKAWVQGYYLHSVITMNRGDNIVFVLI